MLTHAQVWDAVDRLAARYGYSASGLARKAGLDPTTFNKSKRISPDGRQRWPSTESIAKVLDATGAGLEEFMSLIGTRADRPSTRRVPLLGLAQAGAGGGNQAVAAAGGVDHVIAMATYQARDRPDAAQHAQQAGCALGV
jgi:phage repressor protein C with HTH and peptisase S24 domain